MSYRISMRVPCLAACNCEDGSGMTAQWHNSCEVHGKHLLVQGRVMVTTPYTPHASTWRPNAAVCQSRHPMACISHTGHTSRLERTVKPASRNELATTALSVAASRSPILTTAARASPAAGAGRARSLAHTHSARRDACSAVEDRWKVCAGRGAQPAPGWRAWVQKQAMSIMSRVSGTIRCKL